MRLSVQQILMALFLVLGVALNGLPHPTMAAETDDAVAGTTLSDSLKSAAEAGVSVIVIDQTGAVLTTGPGSTPPAEGGFDPMDPTGSMLMETQKGMEEFRQTLMKRLSAMPASINEVLFILRASSPDGSIMAFVEAVLWGLVLFAIGALAEREIYGKRLLRSYTMSRIMQNPEGYSEKLPFLVYRFIAGMGGVLFSMLVAFILGMTLFGASGDSAINFTYVVLNVSYFLCRTVSLIWRMILSPFLTQYRIPHFSDRDAKRLYRWLWILACFDIVTMMFTVWLNELGLNYDVYVLMLSISSAVLVLLNVASVFVNRRAISQALRNGRSENEVSLPTRFGSRIWAPLVIFYVSFAWAKQTFDLVLERPLPIPLIASAYGILTSAIVVYALINWGIERYFRRARVMREHNEVDAAEDTAAAGEEEAAPALDFRPRHALHTFEDLARRVSGVLAMVAGGFATIRIWDADRHLPITSMLGQVLDVVMILFIGYVVYHAFRIWIDTKIRDEEGPESEAELGDEGGGASASRLATLLPMFRITMLIVIIVTILLIALLELGVNVSPLFAGAGVVGLAVGFGAQSLVRDIFSGAFFLVDDAFRKGEYIDIGSVKGTVENISVRSFQLRHHLGPLHTIPFGEIQHLTNYSRDWVIMKLKMRVTYDTDVEHVRKLVKNLGVRLLEDPVIGHFFIQPLKSQGVVEMQDSAMIIRVKFMTKPGDQWMVRKKVYQELRELFEKEGIRFAHREVTVRLADEDAENLTEKQKETVMAGAHAAIDEDAMEGGPDDSDDR